MEGRRSGLLRTSSGPRRELAEPARAGEAGATNDRIVLDLEEAAAVRRLLLQGTQVGAISQGGVSANVGMREDAHA